jgi:serine/threonine-protein kinase
MTGLALGHYHLVERIGEGGMGVVYRAHDRQLDRYVAIKMLPAGSLAEAADRRRFRREALALARLNHPNIEVVHDFATQDGVDYLVTEFIAGTNLSDKLARGALPEKDVARLGMQLAQGLSSAHKAGVIHRDLKPSNLRVTPDGRLKILDFGLASLLHAPSIVTTESASAINKSCAGTLPYVPPEQLQGNPPTPQGDIYSAGVVLYEMATGRCPFAADTLSRQVSAIVSEPPVAPRVLNAGVSPDLERVILKCLEKNPEDRYQSADDLEVDLRKLASPTTTRSAPQVRVTPRRRRAYIWAATLTAAILLAVFAATFAPGVWTRLFSSSKINSIAVLPLDNLSGDPQQDYLADGMTEALITDLAQISALRVISRTSVMSYKRTTKRLPDIARELHVDVVLAGSVQRSGDRVLVTAQLIDGPSDRHLWARSYAENMSDILALQREVARAIASEVRVKLTPQENALLAKARPVNPRAQEDYLIGRHYWYEQSKDTARKSVEYLEQAVSEDPTYAPAYAALSLAYNLMVDVSAAPPNEAFPKARTAAIKALQLDDSLAEAHTALATIKENYDWDWQGAEQEYRRAIALNPGYEVAHAWYSDLLLETGRFPEAVAEAKRAQELDPRSVFVNTNLSGILYISGAYDDAVTICNKTLALDPTSARAYRHLAHVHLERKQYSDAVADFRKAVELSNNRADYLADLGNALAISGEMQQARTILAQLEADVHRGTATPDHVAVVYAGLNDAEQALKWLSKAVDERSPGVALMNVATAFRSLHGDSRFQRLLLRVGLLTDRYALGSQTTL